MRTNIHTYTYCISIIHSTPIQDINIEINIHNQVYSPTKKNKGRNGGDGGMWRGLGVMPAAVLGYCVTLIKPTPLYLLPL